MLSAKNACIKELTRIPGVGKSIAGDLYEIGIRHIEDLKGIDPGLLYSRSNEHAGCIQDRCLLYVFRCAVYFANTNEHEPELLKWWNWKDEKSDSPGKGRKKKSE